MVKNASAFLEFFDGGGQRRLLIEFLLNLDLLVDGVTQVEGGKISLE